MVVRKKTRTTQSTAPKTQSTQGKSMPEIHEKEFSPARLINVNITRTVNLGNYESVKIGFGYSENVPDDADMTKAFDAVYTMLDEKMNTRLEEYEGEEEVEEEVEEEPVPEKKKPADKKKPAEKKKEEPEEEEDWEDEEEDGEEEEEDGEEEEEELSEEDVMAMTKIELKDLIKEEKLDVNIKLSLKDLREAVIEALFEEEDGEEEEEDGEASEDWDDDDWDEEDEK